jgi:ABC-2 type transport system ATP-binding protein
MRTEFPPSSSFASGETIASLAAVSKTYAPVTALRAVDLSIHGGELLALLGPNGAGKTTAVRLLLGLVAPSAGRVSVFGGNPVNPAVRVRTGAMLQVAKVPETLKVREHIDLFSSYYPSPLPMAEVLAIAGAEKIKDRCFGELSGGQKQRVLFALAICGNPDILFLDEPTVGMDVEARRGLWEQVRKLVRRGKTVLLTTHYLEEVDALADRVVVLDKGSIIAEGTSAEIKAKAAGKRIRCVSIVDLEFVRAFPGVQSVRRDGARLDIQAIEAEPVLRELFARDASLCGLEITSAGLEEAFLALTAQPPNAIN